MGKSSGGYALIYFATLITVLFLDLVSKELAEVYLSKTVYEPLPFLKLSLTYNKGAAFGLFADLPEWLRVPLLVITPILAFFITLIYSRREKDITMVGGMGLIGGGALGNLYDRLVLGRVRDFVHLHIGDFYWPAFNVADASITTAVLLIILRYLGR